MLDLPRKQILGPEELPGQTYDATQQCNLTFGPEYSVCPGMDVCARLWCAVVRQGQMVCLTKKLPAVEGTPCGKGRICLQGKCVDKTKKKYYSVSVFFLLFLFFGQLKCQDPTEEVLFGTCVVTVIRGLHFLAKRFCPSIICSNSICRLQQPHQQPNTGKPATNRDFLASRSISHTNPYSHLRAEPLWCTLEAHF